MAGRFSGKVAVVTRGSSRMGRAISLAFAREGAKVVVADVVADGGEETASVIRDSGAEATFVKTDVTVASQVEAMVDTYGDLDFASNNAGITQAVAAIHQLQKADWDRVIDINLKGVWLCMRHQIQAMLRYGGGTIVNTSSSASLRAAPNIAAYKASKHGVNALTQGAAVEYARKGIRVNAICPGTTRTPMIEWFVAHSPEHTIEGIGDDIPMGRLGTPEEQAEALLWLCSDAASYVTRVILSVDGGEISSR